MAPLSEKQRPRLNGGEKEPLLDARALVVALVGFLAATKRLLARIERRRRMLARQAKRLLPWWSRFLPQRVAQRLFNLLGLKEL